MGRRIAVCAVLAVLVVSLTACACGRGNTAAGTKSGTTAASSSGSGSNAAACPAAPCVHIPDCTACYRSEEDRDMGRIQDNTPPGGCCKCEDGPLKHHRYHDPCGSCASCK